MYALMMTNYEITRHCIYVCEWFVMKISYVIMKSSIYVWEWIVMKRPLAQRYWDKDIDLQCTYDLLYTLNTKNVKNCMY